MQKRAKAPSEDADRTKTCRHPSQFAKFSLYKSAPCPLLVRRGVPRNIARTAGVLLCSHKLFKLGLNGEGSGVLMDTFEVDNKGS